MTIPDWSRAFNQLFKRVYDIEQGMYNPSVGTSNSFETIHLGPPGNVITLVATQNSVGNLGATTGTFFSNIFIDVDWDAPADGHAVEYEVEISKKVDDVYQISQTRRCIGTEARIERLEPNSIYGVRVFAINRIGRYSTPSPPSGFIDIATTKDTSIPPAVSDVVVARGATTVVVKWTPLTESQAQDVALGTGSYQVQIAQSDTFAVPDRDETTYSAIIAFNDVNAPGDYFARVRPIDESGNVGPWSTTTSSVNAGGVVDSMIVAGLNAAKITFGEMSGNRIQANTLNANRITTSELTASDITLNGGSFRAGTPPTNGMLINSQGIRLYSGGVVTIALDALTGTGSFTGTISSSTITGGQINGAVFTTSPTGTGKRTQIGGSFQGYVPSQYSVDALGIFTGHSKEYAAAQMTAGAFLNQGDAGWVQWSSPIFLQNPAANPIIFTSAQYAHIRLESAGINHNRNSHIGTRSGTVNIDCDGGNSLIFMLSGAVLRANGTLDIRSFNADTHVKGATNMTMSADNGTVNIYSGVGQTHVSGHGNVYVFSAIGTLNMYSNSSALFLNGYTTAQIFGQAGTRGIVFGAGETNLWTPGESWFNFIHGGYVLAQMRKSGPALDMRLMFPPPSSTDALMRISLVSGQLWYDSSSERYKEGIRNFSDKFDVTSIDKIRTIAYQERDGNTKKLKPHHYMGFSAEQLHEVYPQLVVLNKEEEPTSVLYDKVTVLAIEAIKDLRKRVKELEDARS